MRILSDIKCLQLRCPSSHSLTPIAPHRIPSPHLPYCTATTTSTSRHTRPPHLMAQYHTASHHTASHGMLIVFLQHNFLLLTSLDTTMKLHRMIQCADVQTNAATSRCRTEEQEGTRGSVRGSVVDLDRIDDTSHESVGVPLSSSSNAPISPGLLLQLSFVDPPSIITIHVHAFYLLPTPSVPAARATPARSLSLAHKFTCSFCNLHVITSSFTEDCRLIRRCTGCVGRCRDPDHPEDWELGMCVITEILRTRAAEASSHKIPSHRVLTPFHFGSHLPCHISTLPCALQPWLMPCAYLMPPDDSSSKPASLEEVHNDEFCSV